MRAIKDVVHRPSCGVNCTCHVSREEFRDRL
jgi:hypothetical protein